LGEEVRELAALRHGLTLHVCYRFPLAADCAAAAYDSVGIVTADVLRRVLPLDDYDVYLCGPPPFMQGVYAALRSLGVPRHRIACETFGPATVLEEPEIGQVHQPAEAPRPAAQKRRPRAARSRTAKAAEAATTATGHAIMVEFRRSKRSVPWEDARSLLDFAEQQGLKPDFSCRAGVCGSCKVALLEGEVAYVQEPLDPPEEGSALICSCKPRSSIVVDL
jgi:ferredoxin